MIRTNPTSLAKGKEMRVQLVGALLVSVSLAACRTNSTASPTPAEVPLLAKAEQLVVVTTPSWDAVRGSLWRFSRTSVGGGWRSEGGPVPIVVGQTGLAWGVGFDGLAAAGQSDPHKREGDGKSPAGIFPLDTVFGYAPASTASSIRMPYVQLTSGSDCVDDSVSLHYNTVVDRSVIPRIDWNSAEHMREIWQYEIGVIVGYNAAPPVRGRGSCIFLHIWGGPDSHTAGCTAFDRAALEKLVMWLDRRNAPLLVQLPANEYTRLRERWALPALSDERP